MKFLHGLLALLFSAGSMLAWSQHAHYNFLRRDVNDGLSHNQANCFLRDSRGFVWIGTMSGLNRYDGYSFKVFYNKVDDSTSLVYNYVNKLFEDPKGRIWVSTHFGNCVYDPQREVFIRNTAKLLEEFGIPAGDIIQIKRDKQGYYWFIHSELGIFRYDSASGATHVLPNEKVAVTSFSEDHQWILMRRENLKVRRETSA